jgi:hypothetical protein
LAALILTDPRQRTARAQVASRTSPHQFGYLDNGTIRIGVDLQGGGSIGYLSDSRTRENIVNINNFGAYIGQSYYSGPHPFGSPIHPNRKWGWNPVSAGDTYHHPSKILDYKNDGKQIYIKSQPLQYALDRYSGDCTMEVWIALEGNTAQVWNRLVNNRSDKAQYPVHEQEEPAAYVTGPYWNLYTYSGSQPYTNDTLRLLDHYRPPPWTKFKATENWAAAVNDQNWGLGIYKPGTYTWVGGYNSGQTQRGVKKMRGTQYDLPNGYLAPDVPEIIDWNIVYAFKYTMILGNLRDIRAYVYKNRPSDTRPDYRFVKDRQHWFYDNCHDAGWPIQGFVRVIMEQPDPKMMGPEQWWSAADAPKLYIRAAYHTKPGKAELYWRVVDQEGTSPKRMISFPVNPDGQYHTYEVNLASVPTYQGTITGLRFDPIPNGSPGEYVDVAYISYKNYDAATRSAAESSSRTAVVLNP